MVLTISLTGKNIISTANNNLLKYDFPTTAQFTNHEICLTGATLYYSWFNIDSILYNNNIFYYYWFYATGNPFTLSANNPYTTVTTTGPSGETITTTYYYDAVADLTYTQYPVILPDGIYELNGIVNYLQFTMQNNKTYAKNDTTLNNVYYVNMMVNPTAYCIDVTCYQVLSAQPAGITYQFPAPTQNFTPLVRFPPNFNAILGFTVAYKVDIVTKPSPSVTDKTFVKYSSNVAPQVQPNPTIVLGCSAVNNQFASPNSSVYSLAATGVVGSQVQVFPPTLIWLPIFKGSYNSLTFTWASANGGQINIRDPNMCLTFAIRNCDTDVVQVNMGKS